MIASVLIFNNAGKARLSKFYFASAPEKRAATLARVYALVAGRPDNVCNFVDLPAGFDFAGVRTPATSEDKRAGTGLAELVAMQEGTAADDDDKQLDSSLKVVYRHYATLYFVFVVDDGESELGILDLIQVFVESLDRCFENVCELDLIFAFHDVHALLDCIITGGLVLDTSVDSIARSYAAQSKAKKQSQQGAAGAASGAALLSSLPSSLGAVLPSSSSAESWSDRLGSLGFSGLRGGGSRRLR